jgi:hypothetical protein
MAIRINAMRTLNRAAFVVLGLDAVVLTYWVALLIWISISEPESLGVLVRSFHIGLPITMFLALSRLWEVTYEDIRARATIIRFRGTVIWIFLFTLILVPDVFILLRMILTKPFKDDRIRQASMALSIGLIVVNLLAWTWMIITALVVYKSKRRILVQPRRRGNGEKQLRELRRGVFALDDWS